MNISIVIPAFNEEELLPSTLESLVNQTTKNPFEVIVVDNNSTDKTSKVASKFASKLNLKIIKETKKGRGIARHTGFERAQADIILSLDADTIVPSNWVELITKNFEDRRTVAVTGPWFVDDCRGVKRWFLNNFQEIAEIPYLLWKGHFWLTGFNFGIRREFYKKCGGFNTTLNAHEDIDLTNRIGKFGKVVYDKKCLVKTSSRRYDKGLFRGIFEYEKLAIRYFLFKDNSIILPDTRPL